MTTFIHIVLALCIVGLVHSLYMLWRNERVGKFLRRAHAMAFAKTEGVYREDALEASVALDKVSYRKVLYSYKPLKLESFWTPEDCALIRGNSTDL